jgi:hypothetical protein
MAKLTARLTVALALLAALPLPASASRTLAPGAVLDGPPAGGGDACSDGVVLDDGTLESGYGWVPSVVDGRYVQRFEVADFISRRIEAVCICWTRTQADDQVDFEVQLYRDIGGRPAAFPEAVVGAVAAAVPAFPDGAFTTVDVSQVDMRAITDAFYLGVKWNPSVDRFFFVCVDQGPVTPVVDGWFVDDRAEEWTSVLESSDPIFDEHRAMLIRGRAMEGFYPLVPTLSFWGVVILIAAVGFIGWLVARRQE